MSHHATDTLGRHYLPSVGGLMDQYEDAQCGKNLASYFQHAGQAHTLQTLEIPKHIDTLADAPNGAGPKQRQRRSNVVGKAPGEDGSRRYTKWPAEIWRLTLRRSARKDVSARAGGVRYPGLPRYRTHIPPRSRSLLRSLAQTPPLPTPKGQYARQIGKRDQRQRVGTYLHPI